MNVPRGEKQGHSAGARLIQAMRVAGLDRRRWAALAGSILAGVVVGVLLWTCGGPGSIGPD
jgi:hypothetical protein